MLINIFDQAKIPFSALVGSKLIGQNNQNYIKHDASSIFIIEACEYKNGFLNYHPKTLIITNLEHEHFDHFKTESQYIESFQQLINQTTKLIILNKNCKLSQKLVIPKNLEVKYFSSEKPNAYNLLVKHNNENANAASLVAQTYEIDNTVITKGIKSFKGTKRRQEVIYQDDKITIIDDYAHHPTEIKSTLEGIIKQYPNKKICLIFQPHQISRTKELIDEFADSLKLMKKVIIPDIFKARDEKKADDQAIINQLVNLVGKAAINGQGLANTKKLIKKDIQDYDLLIIMGAGNVLNCLPDQYKS